MVICTKSTKGEAFLSAQDTIQLIISFGMFTIALIKLIVDLLNKDKKK
ncbi:hypothetical protein A5881_003944 [Enterococcus termitis]|nr:hypothetical protein A5881_003831 [Enterococcus termitis]